MSGAGEDIHRLVFATSGPQRFTQVSAILPNVWFSFLRKPGERVDLLLNPFSGSRPSILLSSWPGLRDRLGKLDARAAGRSEAVNLNGTVRARLDIRHPFRVVVPKGHR